MQHGHVRGTKKERKGASDWYKVIEAENLKRIEAAWQAKHGTGSICCGSSCILQLSNFLYQEYFIEREAVLQDS